MCSTSEFWRFERIDVQICDFFLPLLLTFKAMAIPSDGIKAAYRNHMDDVDAFLRRDHGENFMIWNLSEFSYDAKFSDKVRFFDFALLCPL